jgi:hypothetical protein
MARISFTAPDGTPAWFDPDAAKAVIGEGQTWNGANWVGVCSGLQTNRAILYRTAAGRWIENVDARSEFNGSDRYTILSDDEARTWLVKAADADRKTEAATEALAAWFPDTPDESGPSLGGRPTVGPKVETRLDEATLVKVDAAAKAAGMKRAAWLRKVIEDAVA